MNARPMSARRHILPPYEERTVPTPGMLWYGPFPGPPAGHRLLEPLPPPELLEDKIAVQAAEIERLAADNHRLAASHVTLRQDLVAAHQEIPRVKAHIRSIHTESDIQIRVLLDKIAKMEAEIMASERLKKDLQQAHIEAQSLVKARQELVAKIQQASEELQKARLDLKSLPDLHAELDTLRQEHQRLRAMFEYEKGVNIETVEQLQAMEKDLIGMATETEKLRAEVTNAEMGGHAPNPYSSAYINPIPSYPPSIESGGVYVDGYRQPLVPMGVLPRGGGIIPYSSVNGLATATGVDSMAVPATSTGAVWRGPHDPSLAQRLGSGQKHV